jgi:hypothetical protein
MFFLRNNVTVPLLVFTGSRPIPQPKWGYGVAPRDLCRLQPLRDVVQRLLQGGLMGADLLQTFVSCCVQPLHQREMTMWMYPGPSCLDRPFSAELDNTEINTQIRGVLPHGADQNFGSGPVPIREGVDSPSVSLLELTSIYIRIIMHDLGYTRSAPRWVILPEDAARQKANRIHNKWL